VTEAALQRRIVKALRAEGCWSGKVYASIYAQTGWPDVLAIVPPHGRVLAIEVKLPGHKATPLQEWTLEELRKAGAVAGVAESVEGALALLEEAKGERS
jgi:Holliday junction resolvase